MKNSAPKKSSTNINWIATGMALFALGLSVFSFLTKEKIVYVDSVILLSKYKGLEAAKGPIQSKRALWKAHLDTLELEFNATMDEYKIKKSKLSKKEMTSTEEGLRSKQQTYFNYQQFVREETKKQDEELARQILMKVNDYLKRYGKNSRYKIILAATQMGTIAYADASLDITDDVLNGLNNEYQKLQQKK